MHPVSTAKTALFGVSVALALLVLLRLGRRLLAGSTVAREGQSTVAHRLVLAGDVIAVLLVAAATVRNNVLGQSLVHDVTSAAIMGVTGLLLVQASGELGVRALVGARMRDELARGNVAAGLASGAHYAAMGILAQHAVSAQDWRGWGLSLLFFALGVTTQLAVVSLFRAVTTYDDAEHVRGGNVAAALSYGGVALSSAVVISRALQGDFTTWTASLLGFAQLSACALALYPVRQLVVQGLWLGSAPSLRGGAIDDAIAQARDVGVAALEAGTYLAAALALVALA
jgi:uncharacterized membrane protein YjfL (UPF0719 family)